MADRGAAGAYRTVLASRLRSQVEYRTSFGLDLAGSFAIGLSEFVEVYVIFHNVPLLGGLDLRAATLVFALANLGFSLGDLVLGNVDQIPDYIRLGTLDVMLLRPLSVLGQIASIDMSLRRIGRAGFAVLLAAVVLTRLQIRWTPGRVALLAVTPLAGAVMVGALFVLAGAAQFWLLQGAEFTAAFTYGSEYVSSFPAGVFPAPMRVFFTFVVPASFTAYLPALVILGLQGPPGLPARLGWYSPAVAAAIAGTALLAWRLGVRHYVGAGG